MMKVPGPTIPGPHVRPLSAPGHLCPCPVAEEGGLKQNRGNKLRSMKQPVPLDSDQGKRTVAGTLPWGLRTTGRIGQPATSSWTEATVLLHHGAPQVAALHSESS